MYTFNKKATKALFILKTVMVLMVFGLVNIAYAIGEQENQESSNDIKVEVSLEK